MHIQLNKVLIFIALLSFIFSSYSSEAGSVSDELKDVQETVKNFVSSLSVKGTVENMSPSIIIGLCIAAVVLAIVFRGLIFFMIMFGVLVMMLGSIEKTTDYLKEKFNFVKVQPDSKKKIKIKYHL
ncbi:hypothetical protein EJB10_01605 [Wolbachia endosymbiont of Brugia malayi]|uniref:hypothetical protein n=1 Tax=Wolbachia endosymbiont of Brugia malayi TaxID=80849 RepID=UPI00004C94FA|nr:hypothetical protein [Wolbachia endosymbiont of Brugia malayi]AAW71339.1 Predicted protein [Wolbachia endosymbiont strain TRS of Brugia malayi]QCB61528.1 hypothetical protein EJB10_01605 [Wolbachia endosymbiont of Brugia malayi]